MSAAIAVAAAVSCSIASAEANYPAIGGGGVATDSRTSIVYDARTGELGVNAPVGVGLTSINIESTTGMFSGGPALNLGGDFDIFSADTIFKATFGSSFGSLSFGLVAPVGLARSAVMGDLSVEGSLATGGGLGDVDLIYVPVPEPASCGLLAAGLMGFGALAWRRRRGHRA